MDYTYSLAYHSVFAMHLEICNGPGTSFYYQRTAIYIGRQRQHYLFTRTADKHIDHVFSPHLLLCTATLTQSLKVQVLYGANSLFCIFDTPWSILTPLSYHDDNKWLKPPQIETELKSLMGLYNV